MRTKEQIKEYYDNAYKYKKYAGLNKTYSETLPFYWEFLTRVKSFTGEEIVLEIGSGDGKIMYPMSNYVKEVHGVDISEAAVNIAKKYLKNKKNCFYYINDNIDFFSNNKFDIIWEVTVFQHMLKEYVREFIQQAYTKLKKGGFILFQFLYDSSYDEVDIEGKENNSSWTIKEIKETLIKNGFKIVSFNIHDLNFMVQNKILKSYYVIAKKLEK